jgi:hypothetical protein
MSDGDRKSHAPGGVIRETRARTCAVYLAVRRNVRFLRTWACSESREKQTQGVIAEGLGAWGWR